MIINQNTINSLGKILNTNLVNLYLEGSNLGYN